MNISSKKNLERIKFRKIRNESSLIERKKLENNVKVYVDSFLKKYKNIDHIGIFWPLNNEVDIRSLNEKFSLALPRCESEKTLSFIMENLFFLKKFFFCKMNCCSSPPGGDQVDSLPPVLKYSSSCSSSHRRLRVVVVVG